MIAKLFHNIGSDAIRILGWRTVLKMWWGVLLKFSQILRERNLRPLDKYMADGSTYSIRSHFGSFDVNPAKVDMMFVETSFCFGGIRELYIKDCYLRYHNIDPKRINTVVDLGANRGLASLLFIPVARRILAVDFAPESDATIRYNLTVLNRFHHVSIATCILEAEDTRIDAKHEMKRISTLLKEYSISEIDFLKIDIEGSEFEIINDLPLDSITYLSMEVHHRFGSVADLVDRLKDHAFDITLATEEMKITSEPLQTAYIFARNLNRLAESQAVA